MPLFLRFPCRSLTSSRAAGPSSIGQIHFHILCTLMMFLVLITASRVRAQDDSKIVPQKSTTIAVDELSQKLGSVYQKRNSAVVRFEFRDENGGGGSSGVIVTEAGHVLVRYFGALLRDAKLTIQLVDGRSVAATVVGWSQEFGVTMLKITEPGPWPYVDLSQSESVKPGQALVTLSYPLNHREIVRRPILSLDRVIVGSAGWWFLSSEISKPWNQFGIAFDLNGQLAGIGTYAPVSEKEYLAFVDAKLVRSIADDLIAGKNLDLNRLHKHADAALASGLPAENRPGKISKESTDRAIAATVRIQCSATPTMRVSGTIISQDGEIVTCAHHGWLPGTNVTVSLVDGRDVKGVVTSIGFPADIGIVKILEPGPFPHAGLAENSELSTGDECLMIGYGPVDKKERRPSVRTASVVKSPHDRKSMYLYTNAKLVGGDSGGGLFDTNGRLIAIHVEIASSAHSRVELFHRHWDELHRPFEIAIESELDRAETQMRKIADTARSSLVEILDKETVVALGVVANADGRIWTKASVLPESPTCRLANGETVPAVVWKTDRQHDLAILKVNAVNLSALRFSDQPEPSVGSVVALVTKNPLSSMAVVSNPAIAFPAEQGTLLASVEDSTDGLVVSGDFPFHEIPGYTIKLPPRQLRKGDIIQQIDGHPTPTFEALKQLLYPDKTAPLAVAGDPVAITVKRDNQSVTLRQILGPSAWPLPLGQSLRRSGLGTVYNLSAALDDDLCGAPILNHQGECLGLVIAQRGRRWFNVLPASMLKLD